MIVNSGMERIGSKQKMEIKSNAVFWQMKIEGNIKRDILVNKRLAKEGWKILRFWGKEIEKNILFCIDKFEKTITNE